MSIERVKAYFEEIGAVAVIMEFEDSTATVVEAAEAVGVIPARIAKTLSFRHGGGGMLLVTAGDARIDNKKFKSYFGFKAKMLSAEELEAFIDLPAGGVCPFAVAEQVSVYLDVSLKRFETVFPAAGTASSAVELNCEALEQYSRAKAWVDVCQWT